MEVLGHSLMTEEEPLVAPETRIEVGLEHDVGNLDKLTTEVLWFRPCVHLHDGIVLLELVSQLVVPDKWIVLFEVVGARVDKTPGRSRVP